MFNTIKAQDAAETIKQFNKLASLSVDKQQEVLFHQFGAGVNPYDLMIGSLENHSSESDGTSNSLDHKAEPAIPCVDSTGTVALFKASNLSDMTDKTSRLYCAIVSFDIVRVFEAFLDEAGNRYVNVYGNLFSLNWIEANIQKIQNTAPAVWSSGNRG